MTLKTRTQLQNKALRICFRCDKTGGDTMTKVQIKIIVSALLAISGRVVAYRECCSLNSIMCKVVHRGCNSGGSTTSCFEDCDIALIGCLAAGATKKKLSGLQPCTGGGCSLPT